MHIEWPKVLFSGLSLHTVYTSALAIVIKLFSIKFHLNADDSQLQNSTMFGSRSVLYTEVSDCCVDIRNGMTQNKLQLNGDETEAMLVGTKQKLSI